MSFGNWSNRDAYSQGGNQPYNFAHNTSSSAASNSQAQDQGNSYLPSQRIVYASSYAGPAWTYQTGDQSQSSSSILYSPRLTADGSQQNYGVSSRYDTGQKDGMPPNEGFPCKVSGCPAKCKRKSDLNRHNLEHHSNGSRYWCGHCEHKDAYASRRKDRIVQHFQKRHREKKISTENLLTCDLCSDYYACTFCPIDDSHKIHVFYSIQAKRDHEQNDHVFDSSDYTQASVHQDSSANDAGASQQGDMYSYGHSNIGSTSSQNSGMQSFPSSASSYHAQQRYSNSRSSGWGY